MIRKTERMIDVERRLGKSLEILIRDELESGRSWDEIAAKLSINRVTLHNWTRSLGGEMVRTMRFASEEQYRERV